MAASVQDGEWQEVKSSKTSNLPNGYEEEKEPDFSDPEDFEDDVSDYELLGDILENQPKEADGIDAVVVIDCVPIVGPERLNKLRNVITKIFSKFGPIHSDYYPDKDGTTLGFTFIEFENPQDAKDAVKRADLYKLDKSHTLRVNLFSDFEKYAHVSSDWKRPEKQPFKDVGNLQYYLEEENCNDQFSVIYEGGQKTAIMLNTASGASVTEERPRWTETYTRWSPKGSYLATFHTKGIALWGGDKFKQIQRFAHHGVQLIDFSPCERYLVTFSPMQQPASDDQQAIIVWEIFTGLKKRTFHADMSGDDDRQWPIFKWSYDGKYFARKAKGVLSIYETPSMGLLDKKSIAVDGISEFFWSPADNYITFWVPEQKQIPARVTIMSIPSRKEVRVKNLFNISDIRLNWHKLGRFMCVKVDRYSKTKKATYSNFEIFHLHEKQVPVDIIELKEQVIAFAWEPTGNKFCCLHGEAPRVSATFYEVKGGKVEHLATLEKKQATHIFWSPAGQFVLLVGLNSATSQLEFIDSGDMTVMNTGEHLMVSDVEWDPTGRFLFSIVSWWAHKIDNAYWVWSFQGRLLRKCPMDQLCQLLWRPRPPSPLTDKDIQEIRRALKTYSGMFESKDRLLQNRVSKEIIDKRRQQMKMFKEYRDQCREVYQDATPYRRELRNGVNTDEVDSHTEDWDEVTVEILIDEEDIILKDQE